MNESRQNATYNSIVISKERNTRHNSNEIVKFKHGMKFVWEDSFYGDSIFNKISINDSIVKKKMELIMYNYKKDTIITVNLERDCPE